MSGAKKDRRRHSPQSRPDLNEWRVVSLRECPPMECMMRMRGPRDAVAYWRRHVARSARFNPERECLAVIILNSHMRMRGHSMVAVGSPTQVMAEPGEVFRTAVTAGAPAVILMHNHPCGEPEASLLDCGLTNIMRAAAGILRIKLVDHIIVGGGRYFSFAENGSL